MIAACGGDDGGNTRHDAAIDSPGQHADAGIDAKVFLDGPAGTTPLTVKNYASWCEVTVNGGTASSASSTTTNVTPGTITLVAKPLPDGNGSSLFEIDGNMWHHTDGDTNNTGETGTVSSGSDKRLLTSTAMVTVASTAKCVWVCCPFFPGGNGCEPGVIGEQCL
jgi:hypothetical protein